VPANQALALVMQLQLLRPRSSRRRACGLEHGLAGLAITTIKTIKIISSININETININSNLRRQQQPQQRQPPLSPR
jgi:hypothetical protein